jgi:hypothetical protein
MQRGVTHVFRETLGTSLDLGATALRLLGVRGYQARRAAETFRHHDEEIFRQLAPFFEDQQAYVTQARQHIETLDRVLQADHDGGLTGLDTGWEPMPPPAEPGVRDPDTPR